MTMIPDMIGMAGVCLVLIAYCLLNINKMSSHTMPYQVMNLVGSILLLFSLFFHWNLASVVIEIAWISISLMGIVRVLRARKMASFADEPVAVSA